MTHASEDALELYALGRLPERELEPLETHLLVCPQCQEALDEVEAFAAAMREGLRSFAADRAVPLRSRWRGWLAPRPVLALGGAVAALTLAVTLSSPRVGQPVSVILRAERGGPARQPWAVAPASTPLHLTLRSDPATLASGARIHIVDAAGRTAWTGAYQHRTVELRTPLAAGQYWVRLYDARQRLLQEYGLRLE